MLHLLLLFHSEWRVAREKNNSFLAVRTFSLSCFSFILTQISRFMLTKDALCPSIALSHSVNRWGVENIYIIPSTLHQHTVVSCLNIYDYYIFDLHCFFNGGTQWMRAKVLCKFDSVHGIILLGCLFGNAIPWIKYANEKFMPSNELYSNVLKPASKLNDGKKLGRIKV